MIARSRRITKGDDYRSTLSRGKKRRMKHSIVYIHHRTQEHTSRFGFIVSKAVGSAVVRNTVRRRLKAICHTAMSRVPYGYDVVIRALPSAARASYKDLNTEIVSCLEKSFI